MPDTITNSVRHSTDDEKKACLDIAQNGPKDGSPKAPRMKLPHPHQMQEPENLGRIAHDARKQIADEIKKNAKKPELVKPDKPAKD